MLDFVDPWLVNVWMLLILLVGGFVLLVKGADWLVDGAVGVAKKFQVSDLVIGLTVVAFGTSMPEFVVNMLSAGQGNSELAITNVLGSNAINIFVILGLTALIWPVSSTREARKEDIPFAFIGALVVLFFACYTMPDKWTLSAVLGGFSLFTDANDYISGIGGAVLFLLFVQYMILLAVRVKHQPEESGSFATMPIVKAVVLVLVGLFGLTVGGELVVKTATHIAHDLGVSDAIIGLTIVALGTSLPELATSVVAAFKHNSDLALGNCVGSCTFNIFFVLSISAMVHPLCGYEGLWLDALMAFAGPALVWVYVNNDKTHKVSRLEGASLLLVYGVYLTYRLLTI